MKIQKRDNFLLRQQCVVSHCSVFQQTSPSILLCTLTNCQIKIHYQHLKCATAFINCWLKGEKLKGERLHFFPTINTNFKYKWHQSSQNWEIRGQFYVLHTQDVWQFFASNQLSDNLAVFRSHLRLFLHESGYWNPSKCIFLCYCLVWDLNILLVRKHKNSQTKVLTTPNLQLQFTKKPQTFISFPFLSVLPYLIWNTGKIISAKLLIESFRYFSV